MTIQRRQWQWQRQRQLVTKLSPPHKHVDAMKHARSNAMFAACLTLSSCRRAAFVLSSYRKCRRGVGVAAATTGAGIAAVVLVVAVVFFQLNLISIQFLGHISARTLAHTHIYVYICVDFYVPSMAPEMVCCRCMHILVAANCLGLFSVLQCVAFAASPLLCP